MNGPGMNLFQGKILVDDFDQALVVVDCCRKDRLVQPGAVAALEIVEVDQRHPGLGISANRAILATSMLNDGSLIRSKVSSRASLVLSVEIRKSTVDDLAP